MGLTSKIQPLCLCILLVFTGTAEAAAYFRDEVSIYLVVAFLCAAVIVSTSFIVGLGILLSKLQEASARIHKQKYLAAGQPKGSENGGFTWDRYLPDEERQRASRMDWMIDQAAGIYLPRANMPGKAVEMFPIVSPGNESHNTNITRL